MIPLTLEQLTPQGFAPFGDVIQAQGARHFLINEGNAERYHDLARLTPGPGGRVTVNIFRGRAFSPPFPLTHMERHPLGSQAFIPLEGRRYLVAVATGGAAPDLETLRVFLAQGGQGVNYLPGVWHHPLLALEATSDFLVLDRGGEGSNCDIVPLPPGRFMPIDIPAAPLELPQNSGLLSTKCF